MLARAHAPTPAAPSDLSGGDGQGGSSGALLIARYVDVVLVIASLPLLLVPSMPRFGFALGAGGWIVIRFASELVKRRAWAARDTRARAALHLTAILGRVWLIALVILVARFAGGNADGIAAALVVLAAFTVELAISVALRGPFASGAGRSS